MARIHTDVELAIEDTRSVYRWYKQGDRIAPKCRLLTHDQCVSFM